MPSLIPMTAGDGVKTFRRNAVMVAMRRRTGELTAVWAPDVAQEAMRDLCRAWATAVQVTGNACEHLKGSLLRHGRDYPRKKGGSVAKFSVP